MRDIVFVNPPLTLNERYGVHFRAGGKNPPFGLLCLAAMTRAHGYLTGLIDGENVGLSVDEVVDRILREGARVVGLTAVTISIHVAGEIARRIKALDPKVVTILGGPHFSSTPQETLKRYPCFDFGVVGEGEETIIELLQYLRNREGAVENIRGIVFLQGEERIATGPRERIRVLDSLPLPAYDLLEHIAGNYGPAIHSVKRLPASMIVSSRGCPGKCVFCDRTTFGNELRAYSAEYLLRLVKYLKDTFGVNEIHFNDDNFLVFRKRNRAFCHSLRKQGIEISWSCLGRVDAIDRETLLLMKEAGCWQIDFGIESGSQTILDMLQKGTTTEMNRRAIALVHESGINAKANFMIGTPLENHRTIQETERMLLSVPLDEFHMTYFTPLPGTEIYDEVQHYGTFTEEWEKMNMWTPVFIPKGLSGEQLVKSMKRIYRRFYFRPRVIIGFVKRVSSFRHLLHFVLGFLAYLEFLLKPSRGKLASTRNCSL
jgi:anaerobic magnesium-protoporphyrin IX monomethyl ester cyclase